MSKAIPTAAAIAGILIGMLTTYYAMKDRMEKEIRDEVAIETKVARLEERIKTLEGKAWIAETSK